MKRLNSGYELKSRRTALVVTASLVSTLAAVAPSLAFAEEGYDGSAGPDDTAAPTETVEDSAPAPGDGFEATVADAYEAYLPGADAAGQVADTSDAAGQEQAEAPAAGEQAQAEAPAAGQEQGEAAGDQEQAAGDQAQAESPAATGQEQAESPAADQAQAKAPALKEEKHAASQSEDEATPAADADAAGASDESMSPQGGSFTPTPTPEVKEETNKVDLVFMVDATGSMEDSVESLNDQISGLVEELDNKGVDYRMSVVSYRDVTADDEFYGFEQDWTKSKDDVSAALEKMNMSGGGDTKETPDFALSRVVDDLSKDWRDGAARVVVLATDASYKEGYSAQGHVGSMSAAIRKLKNADVHVVVTGPGDIADEYINLTTGTGGAALSLNGGKLSDIVKDFNGWVPTPKPTPQPHDDDDLVDGTEETTEETTEEKTLEDEVKTLTETVKEGTTIEIDGKTSNNIVIIKDAELEPISEGLSRVKKMPELDRESLASEAGVDVEDVENFWWYVYVDGEKVSIMDANGNLAPGIDDVVWTSDTGVRREMAAKDGVLVAEAGGAIVLLDPDTRFGVDVVLHEAAETSAGEGSVVPRGDNADGSVVTRPTTPTAGTGSVVSANIAGTQVARAAANAATAAAADVLAATGDPASIAPALWGMGGLASLMVGAIRRKRSKR